jgi:DNA polymerase
MSEIASSHAGSLQRVKKQAASCRACPLYKDATQTVFGEGPPDAELMLVGEQPGDQEDKQGRVFVGPAGRVLDRALAQAQIDRSKVFATNAVKHFKYKMRGKRRIHQRPNASEIAACRRWLQAEVQLVGPAVAVAMGAVAAHALLGRPTPIADNRGRLLESPLFDLPVLVTTHPSSVLREPDSDRRHKALDSLVDDLRMIGASGLAASAIAAHAPSRIG